jgi:hypothetical protein
LYNFEGNEIDWGLPACFSITLALALAFDSGAWQVNSWTVSKTARADANARISDIVQ